jgi:hypothetical protein
MNFQWKILEVFAKDEIITRAKYHLTVLEDDLSVETEGNWLFDCPTFENPQYHILQTIKHIHGMKQQKLGYCT